MTPAHDDGDAADQPVGGVAASRPAGTDALAGAGAGAAGGHLQTPVADWVPPPGYDAPRVAAAVRELLLGIGEDPDRDGLRATPERVARSFAELTAGLRTRPEDVLTTTFEEGHDELVLVRDIDVYSLCEHHLLPFSGVAHVGYIPAAHGRVTGLSKLARLVDVYARRPQVQERLTTQVAEAMVRVLAPRGVLVVVECTHLCMAMRGVAKPGSTTVTSAVRGALRDPATRAEAMSLIVRGR